ncbi:MAG: PAS domain S-box protein [Candidatus Cloacimonetes bacterium]|nr:PAS domain S-box protein [Candidatus Cloacimonadota bacterium]
MKTTEIYPRPDDSQVPGNRISACCHALLDNTQECIWILDELGRFQYMNKTARQLLGYSLDQWLGIAFTQFVPKDEHEAVLAMLRAVQQGETRSFEMEIVDDGGRICTLACKVAPWHDGDRRTGVINYAMDITPQRTVELALELSENRYRSIVDEGREVHLRFKPDGTLTFINQHWFESQTPAHTDMLGNSYLEIIPIEHRERVHLLTQRLSPEAPRETINVQLTGQDGLSAYFTWTLQAIYSRIESVPRLLEFQIIGRDETPLREAEQESQQANARLRKAAIQTIQSLFITVEKKDPYTADHQRRTAFLAAEIAYALELPRETVQGIYFGALIHDIGKLFIPGDILNRPGRITDIEFSLIKTHPQVGYEIIRDIDLPWNLGDMILQHHEHLDGSGYPNGLHGDQICQEARIITVADVVESIASNRPYRPKLELINALDEITRFRGSYYDPEIVDICLHLIQSRRININRMESNSAFN